MSAPTLAPPVNPSGRDWRASAACAFAEHARFEPTSGRPSAQLVVERVLTANEFCRRCPVRTDCAAEADANRYVGLWGGSWRVSRDSREGSYEVRPLIADARTRLAAS